MSLEFSNYYFFLWEQYCNSLRQPCVHVCDGELRQPRVCVYDEQWHICQSKCVKVGEQLWCFPSDFGWVPGILSMSSGCVLPAFTHWVISLALICFKKLKMVVCVQYLGIRMHENFSHPVVVFHFGFWFFTWKTRLASNSVSYSFFASQVLDSKESTTTSTILTFSKKESCMIKENRI